MIYNKSDFSDTSVLIPCFNEEKTIALVVEQFRQVLPGSEILVIDNGSNDGSAREALRVGAKVVEEVNKGKGFAVRAGFIELSRPVILMVDGDSTYDPLPAPEMVQKIRLGYDMAVAVRSNSDSNAYRKGHKFGNSFLSRMQTIILNSKIEDTLSGYRAFSNIFIESFVMQPRGFEIEAALNIHASLLNARVINIKTNYFSRPVGSYSKLNTFEDGFKVFSTVFKFLVKLKPAQFFGLIGLALLSFSLLLSLIPAKEFLSTGRILHIPTLITSMSVAIIAALFLFYGLLCQKIIDFETQSMRMNFKLFKATRSPS